MIVYNITYKVRWGILDKWLTWLKEDHLPLHLATKFFDDSRIFRLLDQEEDEGPTFIVQLFTSDLQRLEQFLIESAPRLQQEAWGKWGDNFIAFRTMMTTAIDPSEN